VADRVYIFETGRVVWQGTPSALLASQDILQRYLGIH
jgi:ABC-type branched-subunit amino acid transport system ATPase component